MLRRTSTSDVTVFVALKAARKATLRVREAAAPTGAVRAEGTRSTTALGTNLHVVAVTATGALQAGRLYVYDLAFGPAGNDAQPVGATTETLTAPGVVAADAATARNLLAYSATGAPATPSFATPPATPADLRVLHASCRKPHGEGRDTLPAVDVMVGASVSDAAHRPHLLLLTGDQIYADDVADVLLAIIADAGPTLLGYDEKLPTAAGDRVASVFKPGERADIAEEAGLTSGDALSHLLTFGEYCAMYLLAWGHALWPQALPTVDDFTGSDLFTDFRRVDERRAVALYWLGIEAVRRALANVPTLTIFDDHEVTDDWNLNGGWSKRVLDPARTDTKLGRRIVQNGLAAYAVFQAWGNTPEQFAPSGAAGEPGRELLAALSAWDGDDTGTEVEEIRARVGLPTGFDANHSAQADPGALKWHYAMTIDSCQVVALDTRTQRASPSGENGPAALMGASGALQGQLRDVPVPDDDVPLLVVSPAPVFGHPIHEWVAALGIFEFLGISLRYFVDMETWGLQAADRERFLSALLTRGAPGGDGVKRRRVVLLCGDVHYGFTVRLAYEGKVTPAGVADPVRAAVAQVTASAAKNEDLKTRLFHWIGYKPFSDELPRETVVGFANASGARVAAGPGFDLQGTPAFGAVPEGVTPFSTHDWRYDLEYLLAQTESELGDPRGALPAPIAAPAPGNRQAALNAHLQAARYHRDEYVGKFGSGKEVVGRNTIGELTFRWGEGDDKAVVHALWWSLPGGQVAFPLSRWEVDLANGTAAGAGLRLQVADGAGNSTPLANAWVYARDQGGALTTLRTEANGRIVRTTGTERDAPWDYTRAWAPAAGATVRIAYTRGARPVPEAVLARAALNGAFVQVVIPVLDSAGRGTLTIPDVRITPTRPAELAILPLLWQPPDLRLPWLAGAPGIDPDGETYEKAGFRQRTRAFSSPQPAGNLLETDGNAAAAPPAAAALRTRALEVRGTVDADATGVTVEMLDRNGATVRQRNGMTPAAALVDSTAVTLAAPAAGRREYTARVVLDHAAIAAALGHVQLFVVRQGAAGPRFESTAVLLTGVQLALVEDPAANARGPVRGEEADTVVVDFDADQDAGTGPGSPQANAPDLADQARVRRMLTYDIRIDRGRFDPTAPAHAVDNPEIPRPLMPRFMAELQLAGAREAALRDLMRRRWHRRDIDPATVRPVPLLELNLELDWELRLRWNGGDANAGGVAGYPNSHLAHRSDRRWTESAQVTLRFGEDGGLRDADGDELEPEADGSIPDAMELPAAPAWLEAGRREAAVVVDAQRRFGREAGGANVAATVVEWLPLIDAIRGGDGSLELTGLRIGSESLAAEEVHAGLVPTAAGMAAPAAGTRPARLPRLRVRGTDPTVVQAEEVITALTNRRLAILAGRAWILPLTDACWLDTVMMVFRHESGLRGGYNQFDSRAPFRQSEPLDPTPDYFVAHERLMPLFGPPHGYGVGQLDNWGPAPATGANEDEVWSFVANIDRGIWLILEDKAPGSWNRINTQAVPVPLDQLTRAVHQRDTVRRYNAGREFTFTGGQWQIDPQGTTNPAYPNDVLGTNVNYGAAMPIVFAPAQFGPRTNEARP